MYEYLCTVANPTDIGIPDGIGYALIDFMYICTYVNLYISYPHCR